MYTETNWYSVQSTIEYYKDQGFKNIKVEWVRGNQWRVSAS